MAEALQDLITKNAKNNEIEDTESNDQETRGEQDGQGSDANTVKTCEEVIVVITMITIRMITKRTQTLAFPGHMGATQAHLQRRRGGRGRRW